MYVASLNLDLMFKKCFPIKKSLDIFFKTFWVF